MTYRTRESISAMAVLAGSLLVIFYGIPNFIEMDQEYDLASLSPAFFPRLAAWIIAALAALYLAATIFSKNMPATEEPGQDWLRPAEERNAYKSGLVVIAYLFAMKYCGFLISTVLMLATLLVLQEIKKPFKVALISILVTAGIYLFFFYVMQVHFPKGLVFE